jgi:hypothetical protein
VKNKFTSRVPWREKMERPQEPKLVQVPPKMSQFGGGMMLIPTPRLVDEIVRQVPRGWLVTLAEIRRKLAADFSAEVTCPLTTGIFIRIVAEASEEDRANGRKRVAPYWRVIKDDGSLNPKFPGGVGQQAKYLRGEGWATARRGTKTVLKDFERRLAVLK